ncbi:MAG: hypothetical protein NVS1B13_14860 [Flavisolibacter sp.]
MKYIFTLSLFLQFFQLQLKAQNKTYFISATGNDTKSGLTQGEAWASITKVNATHFQSGDRILFEGGKIFPGSIDLANSKNSNPSIPIVFSSYGNGLATINGGSAIGFYAFNIGGITIHKLNFKGDPATNGADGINFYMKLGTSNLTDINIDSVEVSGFGGVGIAIGTDSTRGYQRVNLTHCLVHNNTMAGMDIYGYGDAYSNSDIHIGYCKAYNNLGAPSNHPTGNGIVVSGLDNAIIEYSEAYNNGQNNTFNAGGPVGIWTYNANHVIIQYCESHHNMAGSRTDGGGFDIDGGSQNCLIQYCYSHDNEGAGFALFEYGSSNPFINNTIRYNISQNDGRNNSYGALSFWGGPKPITNSFAYNNTVFLDNTTGVVNGTPAAVQVISGNLSNILVANNIFYTTGAASLISSPFATPVKANIEFRNNNYFSAGMPNFTWGSQKYNSLPAWRAGSGEESNASASTGFNVDPLLNAPGSGSTVGPADGNTLSFLTGYMLLANSPMINSGISLTDMGPHDFYGNPIPYDNVFDIGANEYSPGVTPPSFGFIGFSGSALSDHALLIWKVVNQTNMVRYEVQKSKDSLSFVFLGNVLANGTNDYNYSDYTFSSNYPQFYKIRGVDGQGKEFISNIIKVQPNEVMYSSVYYKEGTGLIIRLKNSSPQPIQISIFDATGKTLLRKNETLLAGNTDFTISEALDWPKGIYIVHLNYKETISFKFFR